MKMTDEMPTGLKVTECIAEALVESASIESLKATAVMGLVLLALSAQTINSAIACANIEAARDILAAAKEGIPSAITGLLAGLADGDTALLTAAMRDAAEKHDPNIPEAVAEAMGIKKKPAIGTKEAAKFSFT